MVGCIHAKLLDGKFSVDISGYIVTVRGSERAVDNHQITAEDTGILHAVAFYTGVERRFRMADKFARDINTLVIVRSGRRKAGMQVFRQNKFG